MREEELAYLLVLKRLPNIGDIRARELIQKYNSAKEVYYALKTHRLSKLTNKLPQLSINQLQTWLSQAYFEIERMQKKNIEFVTIEEEDYPARLKHCVDAPILLFYKGNISWNAPRSISIVGTRNPSSYGLDFCKELIAELEILDVQIVSGLAYGIDIQAHIAAMQHGLETIACLAHGLHTTYPAAHTKYAKSMQEQGGILSEYPTYSRLEKKNFVRRNRIIAGISQATVVIESAKKGGSLLTADMANSYNREVFAVPGKIGSPKSEGCNSLIKTNQARLIQSAADLIYILNWDLEEFFASKPIQIPLLVDLNQEEEALYQILKETGKESMDLLAIKAGISPQKAASLLLSLELKGIVRPLPGKLFETI